MTAFKLGRLPNDPTKPRLKLALKASGTVPAQADWLSKVTDWPMYGNDQLGDCTCAAAGHMIEQWSAYASTQTEITDADVLKAYEVAGGYNPANPSTDQGAVMQDVLNYWRHTGIGGHQILAFAEANVKDLNECRVAVAEFGTLYLGINFPASAMDQFNAGQPWDVVQGAQIEGGHAINAGWYDTAAGTWKVVTWGKVQTMTQAFFDAYVEEAWVVITQDWIDAKGDAPTGVDTAALGQQFTELTGDPSPFPPAPAPVPTPTPAPMPPTPSPSPTPAPTPAPTPPPPKPAPDNVAAEILAALDHLTDRIEHWLGQ